MDTGLLRPVVRWSIGCCLLFACGSAAKSNGSGPMTGSGSTGASSTLSGGSSGSSGTSGSSGGSTASAGSDGGSSGTGFSTPDGGFGSSGDGGACTSTSLSSRIRITEVDVGTAYDYNEVDSNGPALGLTPLAISPIPGGGSRLAFLGSGDGMVHVVTLDANDELVAGSAFGLLAYDFQDIYADASGGVLLVSRAALGGSAANNNCGNINNLCGPAASYPTTATCQDMYLVRFDGTTETWATKLTDTTATLPAYGTSPTSGGNVVFIWSEYAHNGRIAFDGTNYGAYFGAAITVPNQMCVDTNSTLATGVNIHQGDRLEIVSGSGVLQTTGGFYFGCSHSGYERLLWDSVAMRYVPICKNDLPVTLADGGSVSGRIALAPNFTTNSIVPVDLFYSDLGSVLTTGGGGYWAITSNIRAGQTPNTNGLADVDLVQFDITGTAIASPNAPPQDIKLVSDAENDRAPHLAAYSSGLMAMAWEESTATGDLAQNDPNRKMFVQILDQTTGAPPAGSTTDTAGPLNVAVLGSRYQDFRAYPDGSVAYPAPGTNSTTIKILRILGCDD